MSVGAFSCKQLRLASWGRLPEEFCKTNVDVILEALEKSEFIDRDLENLTTIADEWKWKKLVKRIAEKRSILPGSCDLRAIKVKSSITADSKRLYKPFCFNRSFNCFVGSHSGVCVEVRVPREELKHEVSHPDVPFGYW